MDFLTTKDTKKAQSSQRKMKMKIKNHTSPLRALRASFVPSLVKPFPHENLFKHFILTTKHPKLNLNKSNFESS